MKRTCKQNQHYIPKFLLRYFSYQDNQKEIGVFNIDKGIFVQKAKLKTQASKKFFYGKDGLIEDFLGNIESILAPIFLKIKNHQILPEKFSQDQVSVLHFLILLDMRNPNRKAHYEGTTKLFIEHLKNSENPDLKTIKELEEVEKGDISFLRMIVKARDLIAICMDLEYKLLKNETQNPFVTSDNPLIKYNQFLESRKWRFGSHNGFGNIGAQWFIPVDEMYTLIFYDSNIYKVFWPL